MTRLYLPGHTFHDNDGVVNAAGTVTFYTTGTTTLKSIYSDAALSVANDNPITLTAAGKFPTEVFGSDSYTVLVKTSGGTTVTGDSHDDLNTNTLITERTTATPAEGDFVAFGDGSKVTITNLRTALGGLILDSATPKTANFTAVAGYYYYVNTNGSAFTATLPASPSVGDRVGLIDFKGTFQTNNLTIGRNSLNIHAAAGDSTLSTKLWSGALEYFSVDEGWHFVLAL